MGCIYIYDIIYAYSQISFAWTIPTVFRGGSKQGPPGLALFCAILSSGF